MRQKVDSTQAAESGNNRLQKPQVTVLEIVTEKQQRA